MVVLFLTMVYNHYMDGSVLLHHNTTCPAPEGQPIPLEKRYRWPQYIVRQNCLGEAMAECENRAGNVAENGHPEADPGLELLRDLSFITSAIGWLADDMPDGVASDTLRALHSRLLGNLPRLREVIRNRR